MPLKSRVQHLASKAGILPLGKIFPTSSLSYKERQKPQKPDLPRGSGPRSPSTRPPWSQTLPGVPCLVLTLLRTALQPPHLEETVTGRRPGVGAWPRWPFGGSKLGRAGPHQRPRPAALLPSPSNPTSSPAPFIMSATLHGRQQGDQPLATLHPTEALQDAPTSSRRAPVASSPELTPRSPGPPERSSPALSA